MTELIADCEVLCPRIPTAARPFGQRVSVEDFCKKCDDLGDILLNGEDYLMKVVCNFKEGP